MISRSLTLIKKYGIGWYLWRLFSLNLIDSHIFSLNPTLVCIGLHLHVRDGALHFLFFWRAFAEATRLALHSPQADSEAGIFSEIGGLTSEVEARQDKSCKLYRALFGLFRAPGMPGSRWAVKKSIRKLNIGASGPMIVDPSSWHVRIKRKCCNVNNNIKDFRVNV